MTRRILTAPLMSPCDARRRAWVKVANEPPEHSTKDEELGDDVAGREAERLAVAGVIADERRELTPPVETLGPGAVQMLGELADEGRHVAKLADAPEPREWRNRVVTKPFCDHGEGEIPSFGADFVGEVGERF